MYAPLGKFYDLFGNEAGGVIVPHSQAQVFADAFTLGDFPDNER